MTTTDCPTAAMCGRQRRQESVWGVVRLPRWRDWTGGPSGGGTVARSSHDRCAARDDGPSPSPPPSRPELCSKSSRSATLGDARYADKTSSLPFPTRLGRSGLNRLRERWLALCLIAHLVRKGDWLTRRTRDVVRSAGVPWGRTAGHWRRFPHGRPLGSRTLPPVRSRMSMTISRRCSASSGPLSAVMQLRRSHRATVARGTNPQAESGRGLRLTAGEVLGAEVCGMRTRSKEAIAAWV